MPAGTPVFYALPCLSTEEVGDLLQVVRAHVLAHLVRRGIIEPGPGLTVLEDGFAEREPALAQLAAAAVSGLPPAGPAQRRKPIRVVVDPDAHAVGKGNLCKQHAGFNIHAATKVAANDEQGRLALCKYILRPPLANERLTVVDDEHVKLAFKRPWSEMATGAAQPRAGVAGCAGPRSRRDNDVGGADAAGPDGPSRGTTAPTIGSTSSSSPRPAPATLARRTDLVIAADQTAVSS